MHFKVVTELHTAPLIFFLQQHALMCFIPYIDVADQANLNLVLIYNTSSSVYA